MLYMAPEVLRSKTDRSARADVYSFGMIAIEIWSLNPIYNTERAEIDIKGEFCTFCGAL